MSGGPWGTVPGLPFEKEVLIPVLQRLLGIPSEAR